MRDDNLRIAVLRKSFLESLSSSEGLSIKANMSEEALSYLSKSLKDTEIEIKKASEEVDKCLRRMY